MADIQFDSESLEGLSLDQIFTNGPRRLFVRREVEGHGTYRLYVSRPFGMSRPQGLKWRIQITVQFFGRELEHPVNDGKVQAPLADLAGIIADAAEHMEVHIRANRHVQAKARKLAMRVVQPGAVVVGG